MFGVSEEKIQRWTEKGRVNRVLKAAENPKPNIRRAAIEALGKLNTEESFNSLVLALRDSDPEIRRLATKALGVQGNPLAVEHLRHVSLRDGDDEVKKLAVEALRRIDVPLEEEEA